ncbi:hypothetical protein NERG_00154 [Nematocida ausubeli]|uniref:Uncharacterized protein n=1 Tax=Nematocida ausubeli (strain ATCC PRA-371 / ERTm2) TaxID=1913371 RepID=H8Z983_NEMA1|nr:hypothetical protein NERG_00154 [Nematocida ausubeli]
MKLDVRLKSKEVETEDLRTHKIKQEKKERAICRAKIYMLIGVAILCHVWDRVLTVDGLRNVQIKAAAISEETISEEAIPEETIPEEAISEETEEGGVDSRIMPVLKEEARNIGFMHRKRFFSPEIKLDYCIPLEKTDCEHPVYRFKRNCSLDKVCDDNELLYKGDLLKYKKEYFNTLLNMFPSLGECVSILSDDLDSFYTFINSANVKEHKHKILTSLLMLAEGKSVPLSFNKSYNRTELVLRKTNSEEEHFRLNMNVLVKTSKEETESTDVFEEVLQQKAIKVINFFIENRENKVFIKEKGSSKPSDCDMHEKVQFVNSPAFLIQTYIHHCLETTKEAVLFIHTAYCLLGEWMLQKEESSRKEKMENIARYLISRYIKQKDEFARERKKRLYISRHLPNRYIKERERKIAEKRHNAFFKSIVSEENRPFDIEKIDITHMNKRSMRNDYMDHCKYLLYLKAASDVVPVPIKTDNSSASSPALGINSLDGKHIQEDAKPTLSSGFTDHVETVLLGLLLSSAYNIVKNIYSVDHIESASEELKSFFKKYSSAREQVGKEMHNDWNKVVGGLPNPKIRYMRPDRNQLMPGIINMMHVIKEITGVGSIKKIDRLKRRLNLVEETQSIDDIESLYDISKNLDRIYSQKAKHEVDMQIKDIIYIRKLKHKKVLEMKQKNARTKEEAAEIEKKIQIIIQKRNSDDLDRLVSRYKNISLWMEYKLKNKTFHYLNIIFSEIALSKTALIHSGDKFEKILNEGHEDFFWNNLRIEYDRSDLYFHYSHCYEFDMSLESDPNKKELKTWKSRFWLFLAYDLENPKSPIIGMLNSYKDEGIETSEPEEENRKPLTLNKHVGPTFLYGKEHRVVDTLLLNSLIYRMDHINKNVWGLLLYGIEKKLDKNHPFLRLADNILHSTCFMNSMIRNKMFIFLSHIPVDKHHSLTGIDKIIDEKYIPYTISDVLYLAKSIKSLSQAMYVNLLTNIMISLQRKCSNDNYESNDRSGELFSTIQCESLLIKILTLNGTTMDYITKIIQSIGGAETKYTASDCKRFGNRSLLWIIYSAQKFKYTGWSNVVQGCYNLIDIESFNYDSGYMRYCSNTWTREMTDAFEEVKDIVCVESDSKSMERFSKIQSHLMKNHW